MDKDAAINLERVLQPMPIFERLRLLHDQVSNRVIIISEGYAESSVLAHMYRKIAQGIMPSADPGQPALSPVTIALVDLATNGAELHLEELSKLGQVIHSTLPYELDLHATERRYLQSSRDNPKEAAYYQKLKKTLRNLIIDHIGLEYQPELFMVADLEGKIVEPFTPGAIVRPLAGLDPQVIEKYMQANKLRLGQYGTICQQ